MRSPRGFEQSSMRGEGTTHRWRLDRDPPQLHRASNFERRTPEETQVNNISQLFCSAAPAEPSTAFGTFHQTNYLFRSSFMQFKLKLTAVAALAVIASAAPAQDVQVVK